MVCSEAATAPGLQRQLQLPFLNPGARVDKTAALVQMSCCLVAEPNMKEQLRAPRRTRPTCSFFDEGCTDSATAHRGVCPHRDQPAPLILSVDPDNANWVMAVPGEEHGLTITCGGSRRPIDPPIIRPLYCILMSRLEGIGRIAERTQPYVAQLAPFFRTNAPDHHSRAMIFRPRSSLCR